MLTNEFLNAYILLHFNLFPDNSFCKEKREKFHLKSQNVTSENVTRHMGNRTKLRIDPDV